MNVQWPISAEPFTLDALSDGDSDIGFGLPYGSSAGGLDVISRMQNSEQASQMMPFWPGSIANMLARMFQQAGSAFGNIFGGSPSYGNEQYYATASGGSNGDPHISFNGATWNDMQSEPDLLHSDSIPGGYQLSTQTTTPNANGVTYNQSATVTTHGGRTQISLSSNGNATITQDGVSRNLVAGQTMQLGNETVTANQNGSLQITSRGEGGGEITTTMTQNGQGVDVNVCANNVDLGGAMTGGSSNAPLQPQPPNDRPIMRRYENLSQFV